MVIADELNVAKAPELMIWAHRGYHAEGALENTLDALEAALNKGYKGIEFDVHLIEGKGLYIKHDPIMPGEEDILPTFAEFINQYKSRLQYWIDFKNLSVANAQEAQQLLTECLAGDIVLESNCYLAAEDIRALPIVKNHITRINLIAHLTDSHDMDESFQLIKEYKIANIAVDQRLINAEFVKKCGDLNIFAYTVNFDEDLSRLQALGIKIITSDVIC